MLVLLTAAACAAPFGVGLPSTRQVEADAAYTLDHARSFRIAGSYGEAGAKTVIDLRQQASIARQVTLTNPQVRLEAIVMGDHAWFRGQQFAAGRLGSDPVSQNMARAAGTGWWKGSPGAAPALPDFTTGNDFRSTFLGTAVDRRTDGETVAGTPAIRMSGARGDVYLAAASPHQVLRVHLAPGVKVDGLMRADFVYSDYNADFNIAVPQEVIDFSNLSTAPPIYTVLSVDTGRCLTSCRLDATLKNLGGTGSAKAASRVSFTLTDPAGKAALGACSAAVIPDVGFNATTTAGCTIALSSQPAAAALATAVVDNPGP